MGVLIFFKEEVCMQKNQIDQQASAQATYVLSVC